MVSKPELLVLRETRLTGRSAMLEAPRQTIGPKMSVVSERARAADAVFAAVKDFYLSSRYGKRRGDPSICDLTFGNPHQMQATAILCSDANMPPRDAVA